MNYILVLLGVLVGVSLTTQAGLNASLKTLVGNPIQAAFISFAVGTVILGLLAFNTSGVWFKNTHISAIPIGYWVLGIG